MAVALLSDLRSGHGAFSLSAYIVCQVLDADNFQTPLFCEPPTVVPSRHGTQRVARMYELAKQAGRWKLCEVTQVYRA